MGEAALVTDAEYKHSLAIVRSLGRKGIAVACASRAANAISFRSRYCSRQVRMPEDPDFIPHLREELESGSYDVLMPVGARSTYEVSMHREELKEFSRVPVAEFEKIRIAVDKELVIKLAESLGVPVPRSQGVETHSDLAEFAGKVGFPIVVKPGNDMSPMNVTYVRSQVELDRFWRTFPRETLSGMLAQEFVQGSGLGYFALMTNGRPLAEFCHRRIHEFPPSGGPSTMAESFICTEMTSMGRRLLGALKWTGVAMVEFKGIPGKDLRILEVNPKFWGSLDLAIAAGVDFPYLTYLMAKGYEFPPPMPCEGVRYRWLRHDLRYSLETGSILSYVANFLRPGIRDDLDLDDCGPTLLTVKRMASELCRSLGMTKASSDFRR